MRMQVQGHNECFLATVAMLTGETLQYVRGVAEEDVQVKDWGKHHTMEDEVKLAGVFGLKLNLLGGYPMRESTQYQLPIVDISGRGSICLTFSKRGRRSGHIVAFEGGTIYEPNGYEFKSPEELVKFWASRGYKTLEMVPTYLS